MKFSKMQSIGNDFILINCFEENIKENSYSNLSKKLCDRHFGIGADGLIFILPSKVADLKFRIFNPDGSEAEMCGNGIRCFAKYVYDKKLVKKKEIKVETKAGIIIPKLILRKKNIRNVQVNMGIPTIDKVNANLKIKENNFKINIVSIGNPHCVIFVKDIMNFPATEIGPKIENHKIFPNRTNVEFVQVLNKSQIKIRVWERGVGETLACGTGACASLVACFLNKKTERKVRVNLLGGDLDVFWRKDNYIFITGPAENVFEGEIRIDK